MIHSSNKICIKEATEGKQAKMAFKQSLHLTVSVLPVYPFISRLFVRIADHFSQCAHKIFLKRKVTNEGLFEPGKIPVHEHTLKLTNNRPELLIKDISYPKQSGPLGN